LLDKYSGRIIEGLIMSVITGLFITGIVNGNSTNMEGVEYLPDTNLVRIMAIIGLVALIEGVVYIMDKGSASILMVGAVLIYSVKILYDNPEKIYFAIIMGIISTLATLYVKDDLIDTINKANKFLHNKVLQNKEIPEKSVYIVLAVIALAIIAFIGGVTVYRYKTFSNSTYDFGIFTQMFENIMNKGLPVTTVERKELGEFSHFGVHFSPIFYIMMPYYMIFSSPVAIQMFQAIILGLTVFPLFFLCKHYGLTNKYSCLICVLYGIFPATAAGTFYDFHENCFIPLLLTLFVLMIEKKKDVFAVIAGMLLLMVKEDAACYILVFGVYLIFSNREKIRGIIMSIVSLVYFAVAIAIVHSYGIGDLASTRYGNVMYDKEGGLIQVLVSLIANPGYVLGQIASEEKIQYILLMFIPIGIALFQKKKNYARYILLGTIIVFNVIPMYQYMYDINFQYSFGGVIFLLYIGIMTVSDWDEDRKSNWMTVSLTMTAMLFVAFVAPRYNRYVERYDVFESDYVAMQEAIDLIPEDASVISSAFIIPHLYYIEELDDLRTITAMGKPVEVTFDEDYAVLDLRYDDVEEYIVELQQYEKIAEVPNYIIVYKRVGINEQ